jgi:hypothetical protein
MIRMLISAALLCVQPGASSLEGVIGSWAVHADASGAPAIMTDGSKWSGSTSHDALTPMARVLFGQVSPVFLANGESPNAFPFAVDRRTRDFRAGDVRVQFKLISGPTDQSAGIVLGLQSSGEYVFVRYNTKDGNLALWRYADGDRRVIAKGVGLKQLPLGEWHELVVRVRDGAVTAAVVGHPELDAQFTLDAPLRGRVGVWAKRDVVTAFRRFEVRRVRVVRPSARRRSEQ